jgi:hypothetical protein
MVFTILNSTGFSQSHLAVSQFSQDVLDNPRINATLIDGLISYTEIIKFTGTTVRNAVVLKNGYASAVILNPHDWKPGISGRIIRSIDIVFTRYPLKKENWLTNYYDLLAGRLKELFKLDPGLNDKRIVYRMVVQTGCITDSEAREYFHGIVIRYEDEPAVKSIAYPSRKRDDITRERLKMINNQVTDSAFKYDEYIDFFEDQLPADQDSITRPSPSKLKCPDFLKKRKHF